MHNFRSVHLCQPLIDIDDTTVAGRICVLLFPADPLAGSWTFALTMTRNAISFGIEGSIRTSRGGRVDIKTLKAIGIPPLASPGFGRPPS